MALTSLKLVKYYDDSEETADNIEMSVEIDTGRSGED